MASSGPLSYNEVASLYLVISLGNPSAARRFTPSPCTTSTSNAESLMRQCASLSVSLADTRIMADATDRLFAISNQSMVKDSL